MIAYASFVTAVAAAFLTYVFSTPGDQIIAAAVGGVLAGHAVGLAILALVLHR